VPGGAGPDEERGREDRNNEDDGAHRRALKPNEWPGKQAQAGRRLSSAGADEPRVNKLTVGA
ncbi:MAG: hypothetical protein MUO41_10590, partial [Methyloceanibacter sp.]|nr:hypothetical protein [Methyloceanibacter sp.]